MTYLIVSITDCIIGFKFVVTNCLQHIYKKVYCLHLFECIINDYTFEMNCTLDEIYFSLFVKSFISFKLSFSLSNDNTVKVSSMDEIFLNAKSLLLFNGILWTLMADISDCIVSLVSVLELTTK